MYRLLLVTTLLAANPLPAQGPLTVGITKSSSSGSGGDYSSRDHLEGGQIALAWRPARASHLAWMVQVEGDVTALSRAAEAICLTSAGSSSCQLAFPAMFGVNVGTGVVGTLLGRIETALSAGPGVYRGVDHTVGVLVGEASGTVYPFRAVGITMGRKV